MRRFTVYAVECTERDLWAWQDVGFKLAETGSVVEKEDPPDVVLLRLIEKHETAWQRIKSLLPKLYVVMSSREIPPPETLSGIYEHQLIAGKDIRFNIGSRLQGKVAVPDWEALSGSVLPTEEEQVKAVAGSVYRFLLEDVFRETAEWCGHMSSVVGPC